MSPLPLRPLTLRQRIAWLAEMRLRCTRDLPGFRAAEAYPYRVIDRIDRADYLRIGYDGEEENVRAYVPELAVRVEDSHGDLHAFTDRHPDSIGGYSKGIQECRHIHPLDTLSAHFEISEVPTLPQANPLGHLDALERLDALTTGLPFTLKNFQREDLGVAALLDALILSWDKGGGKTIAGFLWPMLKGASRTLLVVPAGLEPKTTREAREKFGLAIDQFEISNLESQTPTPFLVANYHQLARLTPTQLAALDAAIDCVVIDEGTRIKSPTARIATAIRSLNPRYRLILSATPIKNRIGDFFWLAQWIAGAPPSSTLDPHSSTFAPSWPYEPTEAGRRRFVQDFSIVERVSRPGRRDFLRTTPRIGNPLGLHRLIAPFVLRRTKAEMGIPIPKKHLHTNRHPLGESQAAAYRAAIAAATTPRPSAPETRRTSCRLALVQSLRNAALVAPDGLSPKDIAILRQCVTLLEQGEQVLVFSPLLAWSKAIAGRLQFAEVRAVRIDGSISGAKRGKLAEEFRDKRHSIAVCSMECMAEGYDFPDVHHILVPGNVWAFDRNDQAFDRIHRINSTGDAHIHFHIAEGTIDEIMLRDLQGKSAGIESVLDGAPSSVPLSLAEALREACALDHVRTIPQSEIESEWQRLIPRLRNAERAFRQWHPPATGETGANEPIAEAIRDDARHRIRNAIAALEGML